MAMTKAKASFLNFACFHYGSRWLVRCVVLRGFTFLMGVPNGLDGGRSIVGASCNLERSKKYVLSERLCH